MTPGCRPNIGITFFATDKPGYSIWSNGTLQNVFFLLLMLRACDEVGEVWLINSGDADRLPAGIRAMGLDIELVRFAEVADRLDVLIEAGAQIRTQEAGAVRRRGGIVIAYRCGNDYIMDVERICFGLSPGPIFDNTYYDEIWTQPQHENTCRHFWEIGLRAPVRVMPHIWSPLFIDRAIRTLERDEPGAHFGYQPRDGGKRIAIFEPNLNVVKTFVTPLLICEAAYRQSPAEFESVYITNTSGLTDHPTFQHLTRAMDLYRDKVLSFEARYGLPLFLGRFAEFVVSHQWENGLNYLYYDVLYGNYPLIHNSPFIKDAGYYYEGFDALQGCEALRHALCFHDQNLDEYRAQAQRVFSRISITNTENIRIHVERLMTLLQQRNPTA
jgi:hypothetical protein